MGWAKEKPLDTLGAFWFVLRSRKHRANPLIQSCAGRRRRKHLSTKDRRRPNAHRVAIQFTRAILTLLNHALAAAEVGT